MGPALRATRVFSMEKRVILIVDDVDQVGVVATEYLARRLPAVDVYGTTDPAEAIEWLKRAPRVDLVLSDYRMKEMDGLTFLARARALHPRAVHALMTAYLDLPVPPADLAREGVHAVLRKPWEWADFARFLGEMLEIPPEARAASLESVPRQFPAGAFREFDEHRAGAIAARSLAVGNATLIERPETGVTDRGSDADETAAGPVRLRPKPGAPVGYAKCPHCDGIFEVALPSAPLPDPKPRAPAPAPPAPSTDEEDAARILAYLRAKPRVAELLRREGPPR